MCIITTWRESRCANPSTRLLNTREEILSALSVCVCFALLHQPADEMDAFICFLFRCNEGRARLITRTLCDWLWRWQADVVVKHTYAICALIKLLFRSLEPARQWPAADLCADIVLIVISTSESWLIWIHWARESSNLPMCYTHEPHCKNIN
jgi:hypothetical protein